MAKSSRGGKWPALCIQVPRGSSFNRKDHLIQSLQWTNFLFRRDGVTFRDKRALGRDVQVGACHCCKYIVVL